MGGGGRKVRKKTTRSTGIAMVMALVIALPIGTLATGAMAQNQTPAPATQSNPQVPQPEEGGVNWAGAGWGDRSGSVGSRRLVSRSVWLARLLLAYSDNLATDKALAIFISASLPLLAHWSRNVFGKTLRAECPIWMRLVIPERIVELVVIALEAQPSPKLAILIFEF